MHLSISPAFCQLFIIPINVVLDYDILIVEDLKNIIRQIESTEYVDDLFELKSRYGVPMLSQFAELVNREMFWVVTEVCSEHNLVRRSKIIKQFIKIARKFFTNFQMPCFIAKRKKKKKQFPAKFLLESTLDSRFSSTASKSLSNHVFFSPFRSVQGVQKL